MIHVAWDIETCPQPLDSLGPRQLRRYEKLMDKERGSDSFDEADASRKVRSLHPALGWICCASFVRLDQYGEPCTPKSFSAPTPDEEMRLLGELWTSLRHLPSRVQWITFNGKRFDVEFLTTRTVAHGLVPTRRDILQRHPYQHTPHADLINLWRSSAMGLDDTCELLDVETPKAGTVTAATVAHAVAEGRLDDVIAYCEADVVATLRCYQRLSSVINPSHSRGLAPYSAV